MPQHNTQLKYSSETGQSIVLLALLLVVLVGLAALAIDGGNAFVRRRNAQNAADAAALGATQYIATFNNKTENGLRSRVNAIVEAHGVPDTDGTPGNEVNDNIIIIYTDDRGVPLTGCNTVPCGSIPVPARGVEVQVGEVFDTFLAGIVGRNQLDVAAIAVAYVRGNNPGGLNDAGMVSLGECAQSDIPYDGSGKGSEVIGAVHSNSYFEIRGNDIHFHGPITYNTEDAGGGFVYTASGGEWLSQGPSDNVADPFAGLFTVASFNDTNIAATVPSIPAGEYHDLSDNIYGGEVNNVELKSLGLLKDGSGSNPGTLEDGVYYLGNNDIAFGADKGLVGSVTIVSSGTIKITGKNVNLSAYIPAPSVAEGLLFFSSKTPPGGRCDSSQPTSWVINMTGTESNTRPSVDHDAPCPYDDSGCYTPSNAVFTGLVYAPNGRIATSANNGTYIGAIVGYTVRLNGNNSLIVVNPALYPKSDPLIYLGR